MEIATYPEKFSDDITVEISADTEDHCIIVFVESDGTYSTYDGRKCIPGKNQIHVDNVHVT